MKKRIVIIGGVAGGASAAAKARRTDEKAEIEIYERGPHISFANCGLPYYIAGEIKDRNQLLVMTPESFWKKYRVKAHVNHEALAINREEKTVTVSRHEGEQFAVAYDKLILSPGAQPISPPLPGAEMEHVFTLRSIPDMDRIADFIASGKPRTAAVIGGGFIGMEMAEAFHRRGLAVTIIEKMPHILPPLDADMAWELQETLRRDRFVIMTDTGASAITAKTVLLEDGGEVPADLVLLSVGVRPEVKLAQEAGLEIGSTGGIRTDARMRTSDADIYAAGDAAETTHLVSGERVRIPLAGPANRQGRVAGANAAGAHMSYAGALGTAIVRVFDQAAGLTGLNSRQAGAAGFSYFTSMTRDYSHAAYYPGAAMVVTKIVAEEATGRLLGAQVLGRDGVDKRLDVLATAIAGRLTVFDLESLDLAYSPPYGSANDPLNMAGFVGAHLASEDIPAIAAETWRPQGEYLLDVRNPDELQRFGMLPEAVNIPLPQLRDRLGELPRGQPITVYCQKGQRGYLATRILVQNGFAARNLSGGFLQARACGAPVETTPSRPAAARA